MNPGEARLRNLTYSSPLYVDMKKEIQVPSKDEKNKDVTNPFDIKWETETAADEEWTKVFVGKVPIMLKSTYCVLSQLPHSELTKQGECPYDQGGYFVINGSEKVLIAQERMATNHVYVFAKPPPSIYSYSAEIRSQPEKGSKVASTLFLKMMAKGGEKGSSGQCIRATVPYIKSDIPIVIIFRALGIVADKDILEHICYDFEDDAMLELLKPSIEEAFVIQDQHVALDFIGKRGMTVGVTKEKRLKYAADILQKEMLPHVGTKAHSETKKAYFSDTWYIGSWLLH